MKSISNSTCDILIAGGGFAGSLTAMILHNAGFRVALAERGSHPRFAIGESSTPIADMILRDLADTYNLPWLKSFSRYGSWQAFHPEVTCGLKRGFSYYKHHTGQPFTTDGLHSRELLVAASVSDEQSDTNWLRSDFDAFLAGKVKEMGIPYMDHAEITHLRRSGSTWEMEINRNGSPLVYTSAWIIDATGGGGLLANLLGIKSSPEGFKTNSFAVFSHYDEVQPWEDWLRRNGISQADYPFTPDHSALHHLLDEGWMWMLRFNSGLTSSGIVFNGKKEKYAGRTAPEALWQKTLDRYPALRELFEPARLAETPGRLIRSRRLQRRMRQGAGDGWVALPHTIGFVDPLHSTGIAHTLSGIERIAHWFTTCRGQPEQLTSRLQKYEREVFNELSLIDLLVSGCHDSTHHMELFNLYSMLYFTAAITYEQARLSGRFRVGRDQFLLASHPSIPVCIRKRYAELQNILAEGHISHGRISAFKARIQQDIEPYNVAGLLRPPVPNMYYHSAAEL